MHFYSLPTSCLTYFFTTLYHHFILQDYRTAPETPELDFEELFLENHRRIAQVSNLFYNHFTFYANDTGGYACITMLQQPFCYETTAAVSDLGIKECCTWWCSFTIISFQVHCCCSCAMLRCNCTILQLPNRSQVSVSHNCWVVVSWQKINSK